MRLHRAHRIENTAGETIFKLIEKSSYAACLLDIDGTLLAVNEPFLECLQLSREKLLALSPYEFIDPHDIQSLKIRLDELRQGRKDNTPFQSRLVSPSGDTVWMEWTSIFLENIQIFFITGHDISERKLQESLILDTSETMSAVSDTLSEFIRAESTINPFSTLLEHLLRLTHSEYGFIGDVLYDVEGSPYLKTRSATNIAWNQETLEFYAKHSIEGMEFRNLKTLFGQVLITGKPLIANDPKTNTYSGGLPPGHPPLNAFLGLPIYSGQNFIGMIGLANRPNGYDTKILSYLSIFSSACSNLMLAVKVENDRRVVAQQFQIVQERTQALVQSMVTGIFLLDNCYGFEFFNPALLELLAPEAGSLHSVKLSKFICSDDIPKLEDFFESKVDAAVLKLESRIVRYDGTSLPVHLSLTSAHLLGSRRIVGTIMDITAQQLGRAELLHSKRLADQANLAKSDFIARMSHEIRTPLNGLIGMIDLVLDSALTRDQRDFLDTAKSSSNTLLLLLNDILDFSKIDAEKVVLECIPFNIRDHVAYAVSHCNQLAIDKNLFLTSYFDPEIPEVLISDPLRFRQVILNLLSNAIKFTQYGTVQIEAKQLARDHKTVTLQISITDTGIGIAQDMQSKIFAGFTQADSSITRRYGGSGLGLSISKALVGLMGGEIQLSSKEGKGSRFWFDIKLNVPKQQLQPGKNSGEHSLDRPQQFTSGVTKDSWWRSLRVLLAEDNTVNQKLYTHKLKRRGHEVTIVNNGSEAVDVLKHATFDVILMDLQMPVMGGLEACKVIRSMEQPGMVRQRIIALTAHALNGDKLRCLEAGMDDYLAKPIQDAELFVKLEDYGISP